MDNVSRGEILRRSLKGMPKIKKQCNRNEECFWWAYQCRLDMAQEIISLSLRICQQKLPKQTRKEKKKTKKKETEYSSIEGQLQKYNIHLVGILDGEESEEQKKYLKQ